MRQRKRFDTYVLQCYFLFLRREGPYAKTEIKDFESKHAVNRNSEQVPELLWQNILQQHFEINNYN